MPWVTIQNTLLTYNTTRLHSIKLYPRYLDGFFIMVRAFSSLVGFRIKQFLAMFVFDYVVLTCSKGTMSSSKTDWKSPPGALELISSLGRGWASELSSIFRSSVINGCLKWIWSQRMYPGSDETDSTTLSCMNFNN